MNNFNEIFLFERDNKRRQIFIIRIKYVSYVQYYGNSQKEL